MESIKGGKSTFSGSQVARRPEESYTYSYGDGADQVAKLKAPDIEKGRAGHLDSAREVLTASLNKQLMGGSMSKGSDSTKGLE